MTSSSLAAFGLAALLALSVTDAAATVRNLPSTPPVTLSAAGIDTVTKAILKDRADTDDWLKNSPTSYLATVQRVDFNEKTSLTVGRAAGNDVRIDDPAFAERHLRVHVRGDSFRVEALGDTSVTFLVRDQPMREATLGPSTVQVGRFSVRLSHQRYPAIIVFDPQSPRYKDYKGFAWYPVDLRYRFEAPLTPNPNPDTTIVLSTRGHRRRAVRVGWFDLRIPGRTVRLAATRLLEPGVGEHDLSVFFRDATTGKETYAVGRYLDPQRLENGRYLIDFNTAYNPACAYSDHYNCPIPSRENTLRVAIRVGEKDSHYYHH